MFFAVFFNVVSIFNRFGMVRGGFGEGSGRVWGGVEELFSRFVISLFRTCIVFVARL